MKYLKFNEIETGPDDDFLYGRILILLEQIKLVQSGSGLDASLRRHPRILNYCKAKQFERMTHIEDTYFQDIGDLNSGAITNYHQKIQNSTLQN